MEPSQIPAQPAAREPAGDADIEVTPASTRNDAGCSAAELVRRQRAVAGTRKELLEAVERLTRRTH